MEIKAFFEDAKEAVKQKIEWVKENPKEAIKVAGKIVWNAGLLFTAGWGLSKSYQLQQDNTTLRGDNDI